MSKLTSHICAQRYRTEIHWKWWWGKSAKSNYRKIKICAAHFHLELLGSKIISWWALICSWSLVVERSHYLSSLCCSNNIDMLQWETEEQQQIIFSKKLFKVMNKLIESLSGVSRRDSSQVNWSWHCCYVACFNWVNRDFLEENICISVQGVNCRRDWNVWPILTRFLCAHIYFKL